MFRANGLLTPNTDSDTNVIAVLFLATKHELARLWAVDSVFKTEGLSLAYRINLHPYDDEGPARG